MKMIKLKVCPSTLQSGYDTYSPLACRKLFNGKKVSPFLDFDFEKDVHREAIASNMERVSVSGAQEKMTAITENGKIRLADADERSTYLLKPAPLDFDISTRKQMPANEHLTMQIAAQVYGIITAENGLCFDSNNQMVYITKRFDITSDGDKIPMEDFATLVGKNEQTDGKYFKYEGCYEDIALAIKRFIPAWPVAMERFFKLVVFNYIFGNGDDHLKNFSVQRIDDDFQLTPAYDLMNTNLHIHGDDLGLSGGLQKSGWKSEVFEQTGHPCQADFTAFGKQIGIAPSRIDSVIKDFCDIPKEVHTLVENSFLNDKMKRNYLRIINERVSRFVRM
jgi:serine/threonine-protein kinase HipA